MGLDCAKSFSKKLPETSEGEGPWCLRRRVFRALRLTQENGPHPSQGQSNKPGGDSHWLKKNHLDSLPAISENSSDAKIVFKPKRFEIFLPVITFSEKRGKHRRQERAWGASVRLLTRSLQWPKGALGTGRHKT